MFANYGFYGRPCPLCEIYGPYQIESEMKSKREKSEQNEEFDRLNFELAEEKWRDSIWFATTIKR